MTFSENIASTFIGALLAFILGIIAFYITENIRGGKAKRRLTTSFLKELDYNIKLINQQINAITENVEAMAQNKRPILKGISFKNYQRTHLDQYYLHGFAFDNLTPEDVLKFSIVLDYVSGSSIDMINKLLHDWNNNEAPANAATLIMDERDFLNQIALQYNEVYMKLKNA